MKKKHLFSAVALAAVFAGCSQDELVVDNNLQNIGDRPMVEAPALSVGADSRMTTTGAYAGVKWEDGDGFGAALIDTYKGSVTGNFANDFTVVDYINSNILYKWNGAGAFSADATLAMGNYLFYAPFNEKNYTRNALAVNVPLKQLVETTSTAVPNNTAIKNFYESNESPVFVAYDSVYATPKTKINIALSHIYALPRITLKLGNVQLLDENGELKVTTGDNPQPIYETSIKVDSIKFINTDGVIQTSGKIDNSKLVAMLGKKWDGTNKVWKDNEWTNKTYETAATADILKDQSAQEIAANKPIVVKFSPALELTAGKNGDFGMILPGAAYEKEHLAIEVYTTINGERYVSAVSSDGTTVATMKPARNMRLLPGLPYAADEYTAGGDKKASAGTSATYIVAGGFIPAKTATVDGYTVIKDYAGLIAFVEKMAYRGENLYQITKSVAENYIRDYRYAPAQGQYFVIDSESAIALDDNFNEVFENACVITGSNNTKKGTITFLPGSVVLGDMKYNVAQEIINVKAAGTFADADTYNAGSVGKIGVTGDVTVVGTSIGDIKTHIEGIQVEKDATVEFVSTLTSVSGWFVDNKGGDITVNTDLAKLVIENKTGTLTINKFKSDSRVSSTGTMYVKTTVTTGLTNTTYDDPGTTTVNPDLTGLAYVSGNVEITIDNNGGKIIVDDNKTNLTVTGFGLVDNTKNGVVNNTNNTVFATLSSELTDADASLKYYANASINKLILTNVWNIENTDAFLGLFADGEMFGAVTTIDFNADSGLYLYDDLDLTGTAIETININADGVTWNARNNGTTITVVDAPVIAANVTFAPTRVVIVSETASAAELISAVNSSSAALNQDQILEAVEVELGAFAQLADMAISTREQKIAVVDAAAALCGTAVNTTATKWNVTYAVIKDAVTDFAAGLSSFVEDRNSMSKEQIAAALANGSFSTKTKYEGLVELGAAGATINATNISAVLATYEVTCTEWEALS